MRVLYNDAKCKKCDGQLEFNKYSTLNGVSHVTIICGHCKELHKMVANKEEQRRYKVSNKSNLPIYETKVQLKHNRNLKKGAEGAVYL